MDSPQAPAREESVVQWTYDLRGLDPVAWVERAGADLAAHRTADDSVTLLVGDTPPGQVAALRDALAHKGYDTHELWVLGVSALALENGHRRAPEVSQRRG